MKRFFPMHEGIQEPTPYTHKLSCNMVYSTPGMTPGVCNCRQHDDDCIHHVDYPLWLKGSIIDTLCDCGVTYHHRDCNAFEHSTEGASYVLKECTCGFAPRSTVTFQDNHVTEFSGTWDTYAKDEFTDVPQWQIDKLNATFGDVNKGATWGEVHYTHCPARIDTTRKCLCDQLADQYSEADSEAESYYREYGEEQTEHQGFAYDPYERETRDVFQAAQLGSIFYDDSDDETWIKADGDPHMRQGLLIDLTNPTRTDYDAAIAALTVYRDAL